MLKRVRIIRIRVRVMQGKACWIREALLEADQADPNVWFVDDWCGQSHPMQSARRSLTRNTQAWTIQPDPTLRACGRLWAGGCVCVCGSSMHCDSCMPACACRVRAHSLRRCAHCSQSNVDECAHLCATRLVRPSPSGQARSRNGNGNGTRWRMRAAVLRRAATCWAGRLRRESQGSTSTN